MRCSCLLKASKSKQKDWNARAVQRTSCPVGPRFGVGVLHQVPKIAATTRHAKSRIPFLFEDCRFPGVEVVQEKWEHVRLANSRRKPLGGPTWLCPVAFDTFSDDSVRSLQHVEATDAASSQHTAVGRPNTVAHLGDTQKLITKRILYTRPLTGVKMSSDRLELI